MRPVDALHLAPRPLLVASHVVMAFCNLITGAHRKSYVSDRVLVVCKVASLPEQCKVPY